MNSVKFISITPNAEKLIAYCARVSNPSNQESENYAKLIEYCIKNKHWSIFEQAFMTVEIITTRGIAAQILRHKSCNFQEFSQRYADTSILNEDIPLFELRRQDNKNRQNSIDDISDEIKVKWNTKIREHFAKSKALYDGMLKDGIAKESARFVLPIATPTKMYMSASIRSFIHWIELRSSNGTQKEHMDIANACKEIFIKQLPIISEALDWR
ncbi:MAG: FAD-dependent thymidylate synthase [Proteobacteria bacterium]|jgi:thymidylate synthase (FAD)|nr:FAD-dependent thymidylate synthase [Pseudomonadota bacterium]NBP16810.1 FAD-dependent thymidylate synthase [bacterium]